MENESGGSLKGSSLSEAGEVLRRIRRSEGERVHWKIQALGAVYFMFDGNARELLGRIGQIERREHALKLCDLDNRETFKVIQKDTMRQVHNLLASAFTLIDHTRVITNELYIGNAFYQEYGAKIQETFEGSDLAAFVKGLRHWMTHKGLVPVTIQFTYPDGALSCAVLLDLEQLKSWTKWNPRARNYLTGLTANPSLLAIVESYAKLVEGFYLWLQERMEEIHAEAFREVHELQERLRELQAKERP